MSDVKLPRTSDINELKKRDAEFLARLEDQMKQENKEEIEKNRQSNRETMIEWRKIFQERVDEIMLKRRREASTLEFTLGIRSARNVSECEEVMRDQCVVIVEEITEQDWPADQIESLRVRLDELVTEQMKDYRLELAKRDEKVVECGIARLTDRSAFDRLLERSIHDFEMTDEHQLSGQLRSLAFLDQCFLAIVKVTDEGFADQLVPVQEVERHVVISSRDQHRSEMIAKKHEEKMETIEISYQENVEANAYLLTKLNQLCLTCAARRGHVTDEDMHEDNHDA